MIEGGRHGKREQGHSGRKPGRGSGAQVHALEPAALQPAHRDHRGVQGQGGAAAGADGVAPRDGLGRPGRELQQVPCRRAGRFTSRAACRPGRYDKDGQKHYATDVVADRVVFLGSGGGAGRAAVVAVVAAARVVGKAAELKGFWSARRRGHQHARRPTTTSRSEPGIGSRCSDDGPDFGVGRTPAKLSKCRDRPIESNAGGSSARCASRRCWRQSSLRRWVGSRDAIREAASCEMTSSSRARRSSTSRCDEPVALWSPGHGRAHRFQPVDRAPRAAAVVRRRAGPERHAADPGRAGPARPEGDLLRDRLAAAGAAARGHCAPRSGSQDRGTRPSGRQPHDEPSRTSARTRPSRRPRSTPTPS